MAPNDGDSLLEFGYKCRQICVKLWGIGFWKQQFSLDNESFTKKFKHIGTFSLTK